MGHTLEAEGEDWKLTVILGYIPSSRLSYVGPCLKKKKKERIKKKRWRERKNEGREGRREGRTQGG